VQLRAVAGTRFQHAAKRGGRRLVGEEVAQGVLQGTLVLGEARESGIAMKNAPHAGRGSRICPPASWRSTADSLGTEHENILRAVEEGGGDGAAELVAARIMRSCQDSIGPVIRTTNGY